LAHDRTGPASRRKAIVTELTPHYLRRGGDVGDAVREHVCARLRRSSEGSLEGVGLLPRAVGLNDQKIGWLHTEPLGETRVPGCDGVNGVEERTAIGRPSLPPVVDGQ
jgi:hypothetical protein